MARPTIRSIAERLSLSTATVSLALREHPRIPESTRERVKKTAREMGYHPNPAIAKLMTHIRSARHIEAMTTLAFLNSTRTKTPTSLSLYHRLLWKGIEEQGRELGYQIESFWLQEKNMTPKRMSQILESRGIQGLIIPPFAEFGKVLDMNWEKFSAVTMGYSLLQPRLNRIVGNQRQAFFSCLHHLLRIGHQRIAAVWHETFDSRMTFISSSVFQWYQSLIPEGRRIPMLHLPNYDSQYLARWVQKEKPDAIITHIPALVDILRQGGIRVPEDVSVVMEGSKPEETELSGCFVSPYDIGRRVVKLLDSQLLQNDFGVPDQPVTILMEMQWNEGSTLMERGEGNPLTEIFHQTAW